VHHIQATARTIDHPFWDLHKARTGRHKIRKFKDYRGARGKSDKYIDEYFGFEDEKELVTVAYQILFHGRFGDDVLGDLLRKDPGMADLAVGVLMRYDP